MNIRQAAALKDKLTYKRRDSRPRNRFVMLMTVLTLNRGNPWNGPLRVPHEGANRSFEGPLIGRLLVQFVPGGWRLCCLSCVHPASARCFNPSGGNFLSN